MHDVQPENDHFQITRKFRTNSD